MAKKYSYTLLIVLTVFSSRCSAQQDERLLMKALVDLFNYHMVKFMLVSGTENERNFTYSFYNYGSKYSTADTSYDRIYNSIPATLSKTKMLCAEIESLKTRLPGGLTVQGLCTYLVESMYQEKKTDNYRSSYYYPLLNTFYTQWQKKDAAKFSKFTTNLLIRLQQKAGSNDNENNSKSYDYTGETYKTKSIFTNMEESAKVLIFIAICIFLILIWLSSAIAGSRAEKKIAAANKKIKEDVNRILAGYWQEISKIITNDGNQQLLNERNEERLLKLEETSFGGIWAAYLELKEHTDEMEAKIRRLENAHGRDGKHREKTKNVENEGIETGERNNPLQKKYFFPVPDKKTGHFRAVLGKEILSGYSVYQLIPDSKDNRTASFSLIKTPQVEAAVLNFPESYLLHACDTEGTPGIKKKITTINTGIAQLKGEYWVIQKKALIRYE